MSDKHYCPFCGDSDAFCGCPDDPNTRDRMKCPHCRRFWSRDYGDTSTTCLHRDCGKEGSTVEIPANYAPSLPDKLLEVLRGAEAGELRRSTRSGSNGWKLRDTPTTADAEVLRRWGYIKDSDADDHWIPVLLTDAGRRLLDHLCTPSDDIVDDPDEDDGYDAPYDEDED